jgi:hypothetical protein
VAALLRRLQEKTVPAQFVQLVQHLPVGTEHYKGLLLQQACEALQPGGFTPDQPQPQE